MAEIDDGPARIGSPMFRTFVGEALLRAGDPGGAIDVLRHAEELDAASGECWYLPETLRLRAVAARALGAPDPEVDALLTQAIELAEAQGAVVFERRARAEAAAA